MHEGEAELLVGAKLFHTGKGEGIFLRNTRWCSSLSRRQSTTSL